MGNRLRHIIVSSTLSFWLLPVVVWGSGHSYSLINPVGGFSSINQLFAALLNVVIIIATPIVVVFLILAGFKYITARGNPQTITDAHRSLLYGVIGGVIIIGAVAILTIISNTVAQF